jgi:hypothetical protein
MGVVPQSNTKITTVVTNTHPLKKYTVNEDILKYILYVYFNITFMNTKEHLRNKLKVGFHCSRLTASPFLCQQNT